MAPTFSTCRAVRFAALTLVVISIAPPASAQVNSTNFAGVGNVLQVTASNAAIIAGNTATNGGTNSAIIGAANSIVPGGTRFAFIGAGNYNNMAAGSHSAAMLAGFSNAISSGGVRGVTIGGGFNTNAGRSAVILGGEYNIIGVNSTGAAVIAGISNIVAPDAPMTVVGGGAENFVTNNSTASVIGGGVANTITATNRSPDTIDLSTVAAAATIAGGAGNTAAGYKSAIGGGWGNVTGESSDGAVVGGGRGNIVLGSHSSILGGDENQINLGGSSVIVGGTRNKIERFDFSKPPLILPVPTTGVSIGGGDENKASADYVVIAGGQYNFSEGTASFVGGGFSNRILKPNLFLADSAFSAIGGGAQNSVSGAYGFIGGGDRNTNGGDYATIGGGTVNAARGLSSTVAGGANNTASGENATVGGGYTNMASAYAATIPGGVFCKATNSGSFVWSGDDSETTSSWGDHTFTVRAEGGVRFYTANGTNIGAFLGPNGSWLVASDSNLKTKVTAVDPRAVLSKVAAMPVTEWEYKALPSRRYIGPMAQDFHAAFGLGDDDKSISTLDSDGVMYAAIQGLVEELKDRDRTIEELKAKSAEVDALKAKLEAVEQRLDSLPPAP